MSSALNTSTVRTLGQKEYEKRKHGALEVENMIRDLREARDYDKIAGVVNQLANELAESPLSNVRKGALHALAGAAIGLRQDVAQFLPQLLPPVLSSFTDQDARVRYYGCEALYNIAKVARASCVAHFNPIFDGLFKLSADTDLQVQNGMQLLDRLLKDIVTESDNFEIEAFMPLLGERIYVSNPFSRQFLVGWIATLDSVPDIELLQHLPIFFDGLFHMLADPNKEIRQQTFSVLQEFLQEIRDAESVAYAPIVHVLVQHSASQDKFSRLSAISWLHTFVSHGREQILPFCAQVRRASLSPAAPRDEWLRRFHDGSTSVTCRLPAVGRCSMRSSRRSRTSRRRSARRLHAPTPRCARCSSSLRTHNSKCTRCCTRYPRTSARSTCPRSSRRFTG